MKYKRIINNLVEYATLLVLLGAIIVLISWPYLPKDIVAIEQVLAIVTASLVTLFMTNNNSISKIEKTLRPGICHASLADAIASGLNGRHTIKTLKISAVATGYIQPIIKTHAVPIEKCIIHVSYFPAPSKGSFEDKHNKRVDKLLNNWRDLKKEGLISELEIHSSPRLHSHFCCIFDTSVAILGLYVYKGGNENTGSKLVNFNIPMLITSSNFSASLLIEELTEWFNKTIENSDVINETRE